MRTLLKRNIKLYFRDKPNLLISLLAIAIIIVLYTLFLGNFWGDELLQALPGYEVLKFGWLAAGILAVAAVTTSMGAFAVLMEDRTKKIYKGFFVSPLKRSGITGGYIFSAFTIGVIMSMLAAILLGIYIIAIGGELMGLIAYLQIMGVILLSSLSSTAMVCFIVSLLRSNSAFNTASTILGTLVGFLMGIYLPVGTLPEAMQMVIKLFPPSHTAMLFRQVIMENPMQAAFEGIPTEYLEEFQETMGVVYKFGDFESTPLISIIVLVGSAVIFYGLSLLNIRKIGK